MSKNAKLVEVRFLFHAPADGNRYQPFTVVVCRRGDGLAISVSLKDDEGEGYAPQLFKSIQDALEKARKLIKVTDLEEQTA